MSNCRENPMKRDLNYKDDGFKLNKNVLQQSFKCIFIYATKLSNMFYFN